MLKVFKTIVLVAITASIALSCSKPESGETPLISGEGIFILNNGNWYSNDACISFIDASSGASTAAAFEQVNGIKLGDLGQDIIKAPDGRIYIAVSNSKTIFVTDSNLKLITSITTNYSPRSFALDGNTVYVTLYEGYLGRIRQVGDLYSLGITKVGPNPEGVAIFDNRAFVANSGGYVTDENGQYIYNNTISVVNLDEFCEIGTITVNTNPKDVRVVDSYIYVSSLGNYYDIPAALQVIDPTSISFNQGNLISCSVIDVDTVYPPYSIDTDGECLYVLCTGYDSTTWEQTPGRVIKFRHNYYAAEDLCKGIENAYSLSVSSNGNFFVGISDYTTEGSVMEYESDGTFVKSYPSNGLNPIRILDTRK